MKLLLLCAVLAVAAFQPVDVSEPTFEAWEDFKTTYLKNYETAEEEAMRKGIFMDNLKYINKHNNKYKRGEKKYYLSTNKFADMTKDELKAMMSGVQRPEPLQNNGKIFQKSELKDIPFSFDWSAKGAVTGVKDQMACSNGGWAFSATGALEGQLFIKNNVSLISLSEQNLIDCSSSEGNKGCEGGSVNAAFTYVRNNKGINSEHDYTFDDATKSCRYKKSHRVPISVEEYVQIPSGDEDALQQAVYQIGPISAAINAQETDFIFYKGGVYDDSWCFSTTEYLNHYVLVVGYDYSYNDGNFWIIKNSWGADWGDGGYIYLSQFNFNLCGIATAASYPVLS